MPLRVYNTLTRQKEEFKPTQPGKVGMYVCGPTVYKPSHVGHMVGPVIFDTIKRYLSYQGYQVTWVVNITDVDDKLIVQAAKDNISVSDLAERITTDYVQNLRKLGVSGIDHMPRVTQYMPEIINVIKTLVEKGSAYPAGGDVYFDISKDDDYGKLCNRDPEKMEAGARIEVSDKKRNPGDFALWKKAKPGEPSWESPWGPGRPGWHIECTAMAIKILGNTLDIHGGGLDLAFPHHENELAQSESLTGETFVRYWMHNGLMKRRNETKKIKDAKPGQVPEDAELETISKSKGNEIVVSELFKRFDPETLRTLLLFSHYRSTIEYSEERLQELRRSLDNFYRFFERYTRVTRGDFFALQAPMRHGPFQTPTANEFLIEVARLRGTFLESMDDDFNTGAAIGCLFELLTTLNRFADARQLEGPKPAEGAVEDFKRGVLVLRELSQILGLFREAPAKAGANDELVQGLMKLLIDLRQEARAAKNFLLGDQIRERLTELGVTLEDRAGGTGWRLG